MLAEAAAEVLETMFFTEVYGPAQADEPRAGARLAAALNFEGTPSGRLALRISTDAARLLAGNFLAAEPDDPVPETQLGGVVCELANMVCGSLLSRVRAESRFRLDSPALVAAEGLTGAPNQSLDLGEGVIDLWLSLAHHAN